MSVWSRSPCRRASLLAGVDGGTDHLVGMNPSSHEALTEGILGDFSPEAADIASDVSSTDFVPTSRVPLLTDTFPATWGDSDERELDKLWLYEGRQTRR